MTQKTIWSTLRKEYLSHVKGDVAGGLASAMMALPGSMIYGMIAFAPLGPAYVSHAILAGLYSSVFAGFFAAVVGGTQGMIVGPRAPTMIVFATVVSQLMAVGNVRPDPATGLSIALTLGFLTVFLSGLIQVGFGVFRFGRVVKYISYPVVAGLLNGTVIVIVAEAFWRCIGIERQPIATLLGNLDQIKPLMALIAITSIYLWIKGEKYIRYVPGAVLSLLGGTALYYGLQSLGFEAGIGETLVDVSARFPRPQYLVAFMEVHAIIAAPQSWGIILSGALTIAVLGSMDSLLAMLTMENLTRTRANSNRELIGQGVGNIVNALFGAVSAGGAIPRLMVNYNAGGRSRLSGVCFSGFVLLAILLAASYIRFLPQAAAAGMTIVVGLLLLDKWSIQLLKQAFKKDISNRRGLLLNVAIMLAVITTVVAFDLMTAVAVGIAISTLVFLIQMSRSIIRHQFSGARIHSKRQYSLEAMEFLRTHGDQIAILELEGPLFFGATDTLIQAIDDLVARGAGYILLDLKRVKETDISGARTLVQTYTRLRQHGVTLVCSYLYPGTEVQTFLNDLNLLQTIVPAHRFVDTDQALQYCEDRLLQTVSLASETDRTIVLPEVLGIHNADTDTLQQLNKWMPEEQFKVGKLFCRGDPGDVMYIIARGSIDVMIPIPGQNRKQRVASYGPGAIFGEMALLDQGPRSADVEVTEDLTCYIITTETMAHLQQAHPQIAIAIMKTLNLTLVSRIRYLTETVAELES